MSKDHFHIDMHSHYYAGGMVETISARQKRPCLRKAEDGSLKIVAMNGEFLFTEHYHDYCVGLAEMKAQGLTHRMITFPGALGLIYCLRMRLQRRSTRIMITSPSFMK